MKVVEAMIDKLDTSSDRCSSLVLIGWCNAASSWPKAHTAGVFFFFFFYIWFSKRDNLL